VGSQKTPKEILDLSSKNRDTLLFAPEGTKEATLEFIHLIHEIINVSLPRKILLRLHPNLPNSLQIQYHLRKLKNYENFYVSHANLNSDLEVSAFVEALLSGAQLVFYSKSNDPEINPLSLLPNLSLEAKNAIEVINLLKHKNKPINIQERLEVFNQFFTNMNYSELLKLK
jgi:hypothetical protein